MFLVEGPAAGFTSIPTSIYWAIVTLTTVGYGDISPVTPLGQLIASAVMITGYAIIAVPTGIYTAELANQLRVQRDNRGCPGCGKTGHEADAEFCRFCGEEMIDKKVPASDS
jgi:voltage-gated potassium channel